MYRRVIPIVTMLAATLAPVVAQPNAPPAGHCAGAEYREFDFWVGSWDVYATGGSQLVAHSLIESVYNGCGVRENWMPIKMENSGGSLNIYVAAERLWRQTWIDSSGARVDFKGVMKGRAMVLEGYWQDFLAPGRNALVRMTCSRGSDGSVRQLGLSHKKLDRANKLVSTHAVSQQDIDSLQAELRVNEQDLARSVEQQALLRLELERSSAALDVRTNFTGESRLVRRRPSRRRRRCAADTRRVLRWSTGSLMWEVALSACD